MKESLFLLLKGFVMGIANIIPGVSGGTLAITLGIYEKLIGALSHLFSKIKENLKLLIPVLLGMGIAILTLSGPMSYCLENFVFATIMFFVGAILGGLPMLCKKLKGTKLSVPGIFAFIFSFALVVVCTMLGSGEAVSFASLGVWGYVKLFLVGTVASATMVIPGVSGSAMLMTLGYYKPIIDTIHGLMQGSFGKGIAILLPFGVGVIVGMLLIAKLIDYLLKKFEVPTYYGIIGFVLSSIFAIVYQNFFAVPFTAPHALEITAGIALFAVGFFVAYKLGDK